MADYGLTETGFLIPTIEEIVADLRQELYDEFGTSIDLVNGILGRFVTILAERYALIWQKVEGVYNAGNPDTASGHALDALCLLTGTLRVESTYSLVTLSLTGLPGTTVPAGQQVATLSTEALFLTAEPAAIAAVPSWTYNTVYVGGARVTNAGKVYHALIGGTSAPSGGPTETTNIVTDNSVTWVYLGRGTGVVDVPGQAVAKGTVLGAAYDIRDIKQAYGGWSDVANLLDAVPGYDTQGDEALRLSRENELSQPGGSVADAIRAEILDVPGVIGATVFVNNTDDVSFEGMPPHSVELLVRGGDDATIAQKLLDQVAAGIATFGTTSSSAVDSEGNTHAIAFSRPEVLNIGVTITLTKAPYKASDSNTYPINGDDAVKAAIVAFGNAQKPGKDAVSWSIAAQAMKVAGVLDVTGCLIRAAFAPLTPPTPLSSATIAIATRQIAAFDTSWITVISSDDVP